MADADESVRATIANDYMVAKFRVHDKLIRLDHSEAIIAVIADFDVAQRFLQNFGELITTLRFTNIYGLFSGEQADELSDDIARFCVRIVIGAHRTERGGRLIDRPNQPNIPFGHQPELVLHQI